jgi:tRNA dimethylallyltransferase
VITGPTASGKTGFAIGHASNIGGEIVNCDSVQVYQDLGILTARPTAVEMSGVRHRLFGHIGFNQRITPVEWARAAGCEIADIMRSGKTPIIVGGTGLYINILINGIAPIPDVSRETRALASAFALSDYDSMCAMVYEADPRLRTIIPASKHRQMIRAFEVLSETGQSILHFHKLPRLRFIDGALCEITVLEVERQRLYERIGQRFDMMLECGAIDEVKALLQKVNDAGLDVSQLQISQAIGVCEIGRYIAGEYGLDQMRTLVLTRMRNYAKRQVTWFKHQLPAGCKVSRKRQDAT